MFDLGCDWVGRQVTSRLRESSAVEIDFILHIRRHIQALDGPFVAYLCVLFRLCKYFQSLVAVT